MVFNKPFAEITMEDVERLVRDEVQEGRQLDYKAELPGKADPDKRSFVKDLTALANAAGGYIIYGIGDRKDASGKNTGSPALVGLPGINADQEILRLEGMARANIDPIIPGLQMKALGDPAAVQVIVVHVPKSWSAPHMIIVDKDTRFWSRGSGGNQPMDVREIRSAFLLSAEMPTLIRRFRDERLGRIMADETPVPLLRHTSAKLVLHLVPFSSMGVDAHVDLVAWESGTPSIRPLTSRQWSGRFNFDGYVVFSGSNEGPQFAYTQLFRTGAIEAVLHVGFGQEGMPLLAPWDIERTIIDGLKQHLPLYQRHGVDLPIVVAVSFIGVKGATLPQPSRHFVRPGDRYTIDRDVLLLPDVLIREHIDPLPSLDLHPLPTWLRPAFDALWNSLGLPRSPCYEEDGRWNGRRFEW
ncbi:helix-turn-helix domain-containing protein [Sorangium sp. So ce1128]